ncbi:MAG: glutamyl-tRNA reductase [Candidatus Sericytochromatia bacterium]|nr:glutamyl-tRNA reductase [Candidatus Sericytochromatia bacterium]
MQMLVTGLSFKTAAVGIREAVSFSESDLSESLLKLSFYEAINEVVILSTCNRTEFYVITNDLDIAQKSIISFIEKEKKINFAQLESCFYNYYNKFAAEHLYRVISGIDSLIVGEGEILSQMKNAYAKAHEVGSSGKIFNALFRFVIETGKKVRTDTTIAQRPTSTGSVVAKLTKQTFGDLSTKTALLIGTGKIGTITAKNLRANNIGKLIVINRTHQKAKDLAEELGGIAFEFEHLDSVIEQADVTIVCTGSQGYLITNNNCPSKKEVLMIDLSIPRNIDSEITKNKNIKLYDIDSLESVVELNKEERTEIIGEVEMIIKEEMSKFVQWYNSLDVSPVISSMSDMFESVRENEVARTVKKYKLEDEQKKIIDIVTKSIIQKIIHYPITNIKMTDDTDLKKRYSDDLKYLFQLDQDDMSQKYFRKKEKLSPSLQLEKVFNDEGGSTNPNNIKKNEIIINKQDKKSSCPFASI